MKFIFNASEREAARLLGIGDSTVTRWRLDNKIPTCCCTTIGGKYVCYCLDLLQDWQLAPDDLNAQARAIELLQSQQASNTPSKSGRKKTA